MTRAELYDPEYENAVSVNVSKVANALDAYIPDLDAPHNRLLTTIANAMGAKDDDGGPVKRFGDPNYGGAGEFTELKA